MAYDPTLQTEYGYPQYNTSVPAGGQTQAGALSQTEEQGGLFETQTAPTAKEAGAAPAGDIYNIDTNADTEALTRQQEAVNADINEASNSQDYINNQIKSYETRISNQDKYIADLESQISDLESANHGLEGTNQGLKSANQCLNLQSQSLQAQIDKIDTQIEACSGILGTMANFVNNILGNGVDVNALKARKAELTARKQETDAKIAENDAKIAENESTIDKNNNSIEKKGESKARTEEYKAQNEEHAASLKEQLAPLEERIKNGEATLEEIKAAIIAANEENNIQASDEDVTSAALAIMDGGNQTNKTTNTTQNNTPNEVATEGEITTSDNETPVEEDTDSVLDNIINQASNYLNSGSQTEDGECDSEILAGIYTMQGMSEQEALERIEIIETLANYEEMGIALDYVDINNMSAVDLDSIVESAIVQDVIKTTSTKIMSANTFTSKKDMQANSEATDDFLTSINALSSYYTANDANDLEVKAFLTLSSTMESNINQGYVYGTTDLQQASADAQSLLSTLKTKTTAGKNADESAEAEFIQARSKTADILNDIETELGDKASDNEKLTECKIEFLNLTNGYNNAETDSEQASYIKLMQELGKKGEKLEENPESKNPYLDGSLWIAA